MRRRDFIAVLGGGAAWPLMARAEAPNHPRLLGFLAPASSTAPQYKAYLHAFQQGLREAGWTEGGNFRMEIRYGGVDRANLESNAQELVALAPDVILTASNPALAAIVRATRTIPTVFVAVGDPVAAGFVSSLSHPGGNVTGFGLYAPSIAGKWLEILKEIAPQVTTVTILLNAATPSHAQYRASAEAVAATLSVKLVAANIDNADDLTRTIDDLASTANAGLLVFPHIIATEYHALIIAHAAQRRIPAIYPFPNYARSGGLIGYGPDPTDLFRRAAVYVDRILRGEKPDDLPVQNPTKFELVINLKTAKELGVAVPPTLLIAADEVIE